MLMNMRELRPTPENPANQAWQHYHSGQYDEALRIAQELGEIVEGLELQAYIYAYSPKHRDRNQVDPSNPNSVVSRLKRINPENITADNAVVIYEIERRRQGGE